MPVTIEKHLGISMKCTTSVFRNQTFLLLKILKLQTSFTNICRIIFYTMDPIKSAFFIPLLAHCTALHIKLRIPQHFTAEEQKSVHKVLSSHHTKCAQSHDI